MKITSIYKLYGAMPINNEDGRIYLQFPNTQSYNECKEKVKEEGVEGFDISCLDSCSNGIYLRNK